MRSASKHHQVRIVNYLFFIIQFHHGTRSDTVYIHPEARLSQISSTELPELVQNPQSTEVPIAAL